MNNQTRMEKLSKGVAGADMKMENKKRAHINKKVELKNKNLRYSKEWDTIISNNYGGTVTAYILMAIQNQMQKDGFL